MPAHHSKERSLFYKITYSISFFFWPRHVTTLLDQYKKEGTVNDSWFNFHLYPIAILSLISGINLIEIVPTTHFQLRILLNKPFPLLENLFPLLLLVIYCRFAFRFFIAPYNLGHLETLTIDNIENKNSKLTKYHFTNGNHYTPIFDESHIMSEYTEGQHIKIYVFHHKNHKTYMMPDYEKFKRRYSLTNKIFNQETHHA